MRSVQSGGHRPRAVVRLVIPFLLLFLAACGGLPTDASPRAGREVQGKPRQVIQVRPETPQAGASPEEIVRGFLLANVSFADSHEVARAYLTGALAKSWVPTSNIVVTSAEPDLTVPEPGRVQGQVEVLGELDEGGALTPSPAGTTRTEDFALVEVEGEWRIDSFPENFGLWIPENAFENQFRTASVNYLSPNGEVFVPEMRWFSRDDGLPTALARALLAPVPNYLRGAVGTGVVERTKLVGGAVPVDARTGTATVNLDGSGLTDDQNQVSELYAQFVSTLTQAAGVQRVELQINGKFLPYPGVDAVGVAMKDIETPTSPTGPGYAVLRVGEQLTAVDPTHYALRNLPKARQDALNLPPIATQWTKLAINRDASEFAAIDSSQSLLWRLAGNEPVEVEGIGQALTAPSFGPYGTLWVAGRSANRPQVWTIDTGSDPDRPPQPILADWLDPQTFIEAFSVAPDGQRAVLLLRDGDDKQRVVLSGVLRDDRGRPSGLTEPLQIGETLDAVTALSWVSQESLALLGRMAADGEDTPYQFPLGGWLRPLQPEADAIDVRGVANDEGFDLFLVTDEGRVYTPEGEGWYPYRNGDELIVPTG